MSGYACVRIYMCQDTQVSGYTCVRYACVRIYMCQNIHVRIYMCQDMHVSGYTHIRIYMSGYACPAVPGAECELGQ